MNESERDKKFEEWDRMFEQDAADWKKHFEEALDKLLEDGILAVNSKREVESLLKEMGIRF